MPHVNVKMMPGRDDALKRRLAEAITRTVTEVLGAAESSVSVAIEDVPGRDWKDAVYVPEIVNRPETIFKEPGYDPT
ncbi:tautomerase family protein [Celeribacter indicus]|uniref:4-oxalocrotonate tautomerase n=1 Tax=Celeribacter indicus TaxID=1208324 RepID=A0A0B5E872_9RHOB|nr:tautomerase family protein [Celeribacter indicus]AJE49216.1 4-oxalocrotonate tautomerase [Celeribacter indicus]SDX51805.1 4-oxalocrotonate tautomerase [Celeribacter indicus]